MLTGAFAFDTLSTFSSSSSSVIKQNSRTFPCSGVFLYCCTNIFNYVNDLLPPLSNCARGYRYVCHPLIPLSPGLSDWAWHVDSGSIMGPVCWCCGFPGAICVILTQPFILSTRYWRRWAQVHRTISTALEQMSAVSKLVLFVCFTTFWALWRQIKASLVCLIKRFKKKKITLPERATRLPVKCSSLNDWRWKKTTLVYVYSLCVSMCQGVLGLIVLQGG